MKSQSLRFNEIDFLRGIACMAVLVFHYFSRAPRAGWMQGVDYPAFEALARYGDLELDAGGRGTDVLRLRTRNQPALGVTLRIRTARLVALRARVRLEPGQLWDALLPKLEAALLARLGFDARELGQDLAPVVALAALHQVRGVRAVDLQRFGTLAVGSADAPVTPAELAENARLVLGGPDLPRIPELQMIDDATIAYLPQAVAGTVLLSEWEGA